MTSEAVAVARAFFDLGATGDFVRMADSLDPDVVWFGTRGRSRRGSGASRARRLARIHAADPGTMENDTAAIIRVRQQRIVEMTGYLDRHEALRAAELKR